MFLLKKLLAGFVIRSSPSVVSMVTLSISTGLSKYTSVVKSTLPLPRTNKLPTPLSVSIITFLADNVLSINEASTSTSSMLLPMMSILPSFVLTVS